MNNYARNREFVDFKEKDANDTGNYGIGKLRAYLGRR